MLYQLFLRCLVGMKVHYLIWLLGGFYIKDWQVLDLRLCVVNKIFPGTECGGEYRNPSNVTGREMCTPSPQTLKKSSKLLIEKFLIRSKYSKITKVINKFIDGKINIQANQKNLNKQVTDENVSMN